MPVQIDWRLTPNPQHTGSAELRGPPALPFLYVHPQDMVGQPRASSSARWIYNHQDAAQANVVANAFTTATAGYVSFARYMALRNAYAALAFPAFGAWRGQDSANEVFTANPVTGIQPSGHAKYQAHISCVPAAQQAMLVTLIAKLTTWCFGFASQPAQIAMGQRIAAQADALCDTVQIAQLRSQVRLGRWPWLRRGSATAPYNVTIPAGGSVLIGEVSVGPGYEIRGGASYFAALSRIEYQIAAVVPLG